MRRRPVPEAAKPEHGPIEGGVFLGTWENRQQKMHYCAFLGDAWWVPHDGPGKFHIQYGSNPTANYRFSRISAREMAADFSRVDNLYEFNWPEIVEAAERLGLIPREEEATT